MDDILARLERIERRLDALEARPAPVSRQAVPPVYAAPTPPPTKDHDLESLIGSRWLPRAGALAIIAAMAYLVAIGLQRGWITSAMVVVGISVVCLGTIGLGMRLRDERGAFGHVLVGLGTGGLYVDAVGAHLYQGVISSEAMVAACLAVSLASLGYGFWRALPAFLGIGLSGGLIAALMPLAREGTVTSAGLLLLVAVPTFAVAGTRRWSGAVMAAWAACSLASTPILFSGDVWAVRLLPMDASLLLAMAAWASSGGRFPGFDPHEAFPFVAALSAACMGLGAVSGLGGAAHVAGLGVAVGLIGLAFRKSGRRVAAAGCATALVVAPLGFPVYPAAAILAALGLAEAASLRKRVSALVVAQTGLALAAYSLMLLLEYSKGRYSLSLGEEAELLALLGAASVAGALVSGRPDVRVGAGVAVCGIATRLATLGLDLPGTGGITVAWTVVCAGLFTVGFLRRRPELRQLGLVVAGLTVGKVILFDLAGLDAASKAAVLLGLGVALMGGGYAYVRSKGNLPA